MKTLLLIVILVLAIFVVGLAQNPQLQLILLFGILAIALTLLDRLHG